MAWMAWPLTMKSGDHTSGELHLTMMIQGVHLLVKKSWMVVLTRLLWKMVLYCRVVYAFLNARFGGFRSL